VQVQRLLAQDVLFRVGDVDGLLPVQAAGRADGDGVDVRAFQHLRQRRVHLDVPRLAEGFEAFRIGLGPGDELGDPLGFQLGQALGVQPGDSAAADDTDA
jgi:hypothetical protein